MKNDTHFCRDTFALYLLDKKRPKTVLFGAPDWACEIFNMAKLFYRRGMAALIHSLGHCAKCRVA